VASALQTEIASLNPPLYWPLNDAYGVSPVVNAGSVGAGGNAALVSQAQTGVQGLKAGSSDTAAFGGGTVSDGFNAGIQASDVILAADSFTTFGVFQMFSVPSAHTAWLLSCGVTGTFGGFQMGVSTGGFVEFSISDASSHSATITLPPFVADGVVHCMAFVRDTSASKLYTYCDGALVLARSDPTAGVNVTHANSNTRLGNSDSQNQSFIGVFSDLFFIKSVVAGLEQAVLFNKLWNGAPPKLAPSSQQVIVQGVGQLQLDTASILSAVRKTY